MGYDYNNLRTDADRISKLHKNVDLFSIGESVMEHELFCLKIGEGEKKLFINGAHHGLEYLTAAFIMKFIEEYAESVESGGEMFGYDTRALYERTTLYAVPMVNPDGVDIAIHGIDVTNPYHRKLVRPLSAFTALTKFGRQMRTEWTLTIITMPAGVWLKCGRRRRSTAVLIRKVSRKQRLLWILCVKIILICLWHFIARVEKYITILTEKPRRGQWIWRMHSASASGYVPSCPEGSASFGGCKDWFINEFGKAGFTVEIGHGKNPLPMDMLGAVYKENAPLLLCALHRT